MSSQTRLKNRMEHDKDSGKFIVVQTQRQPETISISTSGCLGNMATPMKNATSTNEGDSFENLIDFDEIKNAYADLCREEVLNDCLICTLVLLSP